MTRTSLMHVMLRMAAWCLLLTYNLHLRMLLAAVTIRGMTMADDRRKPRATRPPPIPPVPEVVPSLAEDGDPTAISLSLDQLRFFVEHPIMEHRRVRFESDVISNLIAESLVRRGMNPAALQRARWLWVGTPAGRPELCLILPGIEA